MATDELLAGVEAPSAVSSEDSQLKAMLEAIVYITEEPLSLAQIAAALNQPRERVQTLLDELVAEYDKPEHGVTMREVAGGYKMTTKPEHHETVRNFVRSLKPPLKLSLPALETLAVIAYKQPVTAPEIMEIRGVQGAGVLKTLLDRKLIAAAGRKNVIGKPILYKTTKEFLVQFGLKDLTELPSLKEFEEIRRMAIDGDYAGSRARAGPRAAPARAAGRPELMPEERLQKILSRAGVASRRKAEQIIQEGRVTVNGAAITELGSKADLDRDHIKVDGKLLRQPKHLISIALHKPHGVMTTVSDPEGRPTVMDLVRGIKERVYPVGRLDYHSEGLLLLTNDGELANAITSACRAHPENLPGKGQRIADSRAGAAVPRGRAAGRAAHRAGRPEADVSRAESLVRSAPDRGPQESDPGDVQAFRPAGGEAEAGEDRVSGTGAAEAGRVPLPDCRRSGAVPQGGCETGRSDDHSRAVEDQPHHRRGGAFGQALPPQLRRGASTCSATDTASFR